MLILVSYDVPDDRRRTRLATALLDFGQRVQWSVFEAELTSEQVARLEARVLREIEPAEDNVRIYVVCGECRRRVRLLGVGSPPAEPPEVYLV